MPVSVSPTSSTIARLGCAVALLGIVLVSGTAQAGSMSDGIKAYKPFIAENIGKAIAGAKAMQAAVKAGDLKAAQDAWIKSRKGWEVMEPVTGVYFGEFDKTIDPWPNAKIGYHAIEAVLFAAKKTDGLDQPIAEMLANMDKFEKKLNDKTSAFDPQKLLEGTANLAYEVGEEKSGGGESPFAGTSIIDMQENVEGIEVAWKLVFADTLKKKDAKLAGLIEERIGNLEKLVGVADIKSMDAKKVHVGGEELAALMLQAAPKLGLKDFKVGDEDDEGAEKTK
ncbi:MAG: EfeM/EfeO family lipoprotein [Proteobacteria bacterium]|nr:EfeM/EfeO family lipoprotein [Pseudomonadota bacterium]